MIDAHAHLHDIAFDADRDAVVKRALGEGVTKIITIGTDIEESRKAVACAEKYEGVYASVGIHPEEYNDLRLTIDDVRMRIEQLKELAKHQKVVAIGECGLDYFVREGQGTVNKEQETKETADAPLKSGTTAITEEQKESQEEGFLAQIELALELQIPLIIHCRPSRGTVDAYEDVLLILKSKIINLKSVILHCYMGDTEVTKKFLTLPNIYFSFTGNITYPVKKILVGTKDDLTETVKIIPLERLFIETDCPYLAPVPYRGKRNEPAYVVSTIEKIVELKGVSRETAEQAVIASVEKIFSI